MNRTVAPSQRRPPTANLTATKSTQRAPGLISRGQLLTGSASVTGRERTRLAELMLQIENNQCEIEMQRTEIRRLRDQVHTLLARAQPVAPPDDDQTLLQRPFSSQDTWTNSFAADRGVPRAVSALQ